MTTWKTGDRVRVAKGPQTGLEGVIVETSDGPYLCIDAEPGVHHGIRERAANFALEKLES